MTTQYRKFAIIMTQLISLFMSSCTLDDFNPDEWAVDPELSFSKNGVIFNSTIGATSVSVFTNYQSFDVVSSTDWCVVDIDNVKSEIKISVEPNFDINQRSANISVTVSRGTKTLSKDIAVVQNGGVWETVGGFNVYWGYEISETQKNEISSLLESMVYVEGGIFEMGHNCTDITDAAKSHNVELSSFYVGKYEVTQSQWLSLMASNPSVFKDSNNPIENISWNDAFEFISRLSTLTNLRISLPTEAQWEYAASGGSRSQGYIYAGSDDYQDVAVVYDNNTLIMKPNNVGSKGSNELGLYDMSGNVAEYCSDWYETDWVDNQTKDPQGPSTGYFKAVRGGAYSNELGLMSCRIVNRFQWSNSVNKITPNTGFRIVIQQ